MSDPVTADTGANRSLWEWISKLLAEVADLRERLEDLEKVVSERLEDLEKVVSERLAPPKYGKKGGRNEVAKGVQAGDSLSEGLTALANRVLRLEDRLSPPTVSTEDDVDLPWASEPDAKGSPKKQGKVEEPANALGCRTCGASLSFCDCEVDRELSPREHRIDNDIAQLLRTSDSLFKEVRWLAQDLKDRRVFLRAVDSGAVAAGPEGWVCADHSQLNALPIGTEILSPTNAENGVWFTKLGSNGAAVWRRLYEPLSDPIHTSTLVMPVWVRGRRSG